VVANGVEKRTIEVYDSLNPEALVYKCRLRTDFKKTKEYKQFPNAIIKDCQKVSETGWKNAAKNKINYDINRFLKATKCTHVLICLGGPTNFRDELDLPNKYKGSRANSLRPIKLKDVRELLTEMYPSTFSDNEEADDIISKYQFQSFKDRTIRIVVCTLDKDARGTPGWLYNPDHDHLVFIEGLGFVKLITKVNELNGKKTYKIYGEGRMWFYVQLLMGDEADDYSPNFIVKNKDNLTDLRTFKLLENVKTDQECWQIIVKTYKGWYPESVTWITQTGKEVTGNWIDILQVYVDVVHMRRYDNDRIDVRKILDKYGLLDD
jgi:hypothetical protein